MAMLNGFYTKVPTSGLYVPFRVAQEHVTQTSVAAAKALAPRKQDIIDGMWLAMWELRILALNEAGKTG